MDFSFLIFAQILKYIVRCLCDTITWQIVIKLFIYKSANFFKLFPSDNALRLGMEPMLLETRTVMLSLNVSFWMFAWGIF